MILVKKQDIREVRITENQSLSTNHDHKYQPAGLGVKLNCLERERESERYINVLHENNNAGPK